MWQHAKDADSCCPAYVDFSIGDRGGNELVAVAEVIAAIRSLVRVVQLMQGLGIVGMQHRGIGILGGPNDGVSPVVGSDVGRGSGIAEAIGGLGHYTRQ